jgi:hypothetical protein
MIMRNMLMTGLLALSTMPASAGSIEHIGPPESKTGSIIEIGCPQCFKERKKAEREARMLPPGTEIHEIKVIEGEKKLLTTENWLGGNPVTIVRKATPTDIARYDPETESTTQIAEAPADEPADAQAVAAAEVEPVEAAPTLVVPHSPLVADISGTPAELVREAGGVKTTAALPAELDTSGFKLRTN